MKKLFLLDAYALIYRAYYALIASPRINSRGENTSAAFGFVNTLEDVLAHHRPDAIAVAFDPTGPTFRHEAYPDYKAQREATPEDIRSAVPVIKDIIRAYGIPLLEVAGFEADDIIGTMAKRAEAAGWDVYMLTPDKDYAQLVTPHIHMCRPAKGAQPMEVLGPEEVCAKYGISDTAQVIDLLALMGDKADNIPGCPGVGEKTAVKLLSAFGTIEAMLERTAELKGAMRTKIETNAENIRFSKFLTTIRTDVPLDATPDDLVRTATDVDALRAIYEHLEFRSFIKRLSPEASAAKTTAAKAAAAPAEPSLFDVLTDDGTDASANDAFAALETTFVVADNMERVQELCEHFLTLRHFGFSVVADGNEPMTARWVGLGLADADGGAWYVPIAAAAGSGAAESAAVVAAVGRVLAGDAMKVSHDVKFALTLLRRHGIDMQGPWFDTMLAHYVVQPELSHGIEYLTRIYLHRHLPTPDDICGGKGRTRCSMADVPAAEMGVVGAGRADSALRIEEPLRQAMAKSGVARVYDEIEMPLVPVLARMEQHGVRLDTAALQQTGEAFARREATLEEEIYALAGHAFTITSPRQVGAVLFDELHLSDKVKKTKTGQYSTGEEVLESLRDKHPIVGKILDHRALRKLRGTYIDALPRLINAETGHIHTSFNQAVTATGRLSSSNPNLQNIPVRGDDGREIRKAFVPEEGEVFFSADYSQIELRIMAHLSGDEHLISDFREGRDIHAATAARIFHKDLADVTRDERRKAKTANFGIIYGISAFGLAERMDVSRTEAKELIDSYFATYPGVKAYIEKAVADTRQRGYIETAFGRRRYLPDITSRNAVVRGYAERNAVNAPIQGTAADIIKVAMVRIDSRLRKEGLGAAMILQVHDELNFSVSADERPRLEALVIEEMEHAWQAAVPLLADCGTGANWLEAH
ncbi:MAG: DNA polymerase I [Bacteroidales bacterium]|nr:DNA polymerase I [Bacteroidales bacterium]